MKKLAQENHTILALCQALDVNRAAYYAWLKASEQPSVWALNQGLVRRQPSAGLIHHSDRGSQYASQSFRDLLEEHDLKASMSRRGNCYDNALVESFWATLKRECFQERIPATRREAEQEIFKWIETDYNRKRL